MQSTNQLVTVHNSYEIVRTPKLIQLEGMFDLPAKKTSEFKAEIEIPDLNKINWQIGLVVGTSGSGKSSLAKHLWKENLVESYEWSFNKSIIEDFPKTMNIKRITEILSKVGFSSPPAWQRPFNYLSNGEKFRVTIARSIAESEVNNNSLIVIDEFSSVVDRNVAQISSAAVAKLIRKQNSKFIAVTCHYDVEEWLQPDWIINMNSQEFIIRDKKYAEKSGRLLHRPKIEIKVERVERKFWKIFSKHHYLNHDISVISKCYCGFINNEPAVFTAVINQPNKNPRWREHRTVCLPDFQGIGIGNVMSDLIAGCYLCTGRPYSSVTSHPAMIRYRSSSRNWLTTSKPKLAGKRQKGSYKTSLIAKQSLGAKNATNRLTASFEYVGPRYPEEAKRLGVI